MLTAGIIYAGVLRRKLPSVVVNHDLKYRSLIDDKTCGNN